MRDELGERMKSQYEDRTRYFVPRRTYTIIRLDGKAFHTYTRGLLKPFDHNLYAYIDDAIIRMMPHIQGAVFAYTQADEISGLVTDFALPTTSAWFDGNVQKMASVSASIITAEFNRLRFLRNRPLKCSPFEDSKRPHFSEIPMAYFDSRVFTIPDPIEVMNYFIWRNQDCARNSVSMLAQSMFSHKELQGKSTTEMIEMTRQKDGGAFQWDSLNQDLRFGRLIIKESFVLEKTTDSPFEYKTYNKDAVRSRWVSTKAWKFTDDKEKLLKMIPQYSL